MVKSSAVAAITVSLAAVLAGCSVSAPTRSYQTYEYQCCSAADVNSVYAPGQLVTLHWTPHRSTTRSTSAPSDPTISAELYGSYDSVKSLKDSATGSPGKPLVVAKPLNPSVMVAQKGLSSDLLIPADAAPGYYSVVLTTTWSPGNSASGGTIIQVT